MMELLIGTLVTLAVGRYIFKGYSATGVLLSGGLLLLAITALMGKAVLPASTDVRSSNSAAMYLALASYVLNGQLRKYKQATVPHLGFRKTLAKFKRSYQREG